MIKTASVVNNASDWGVYSQGDRGVPGIPRRHRVPGSARRLILGSVCTGIVLVLWISRKQERTFCVGKIIKLVGLTLDGLNGSFYF